MLAVAGALAAAVPAFGDEHLSVRTAAMIVDYGDLSVSSPEGTRALYARIDHAARQVCGFAEGRQPLGAQRALQSCHDQAVANAVKGVNHPQLTALFGSRQPVNRARRA